MVVKQANGHTDSFEGQKNTKVFSKADRTSFNREECHLRHATMKGATSQMTKGLFDAAVPVVFLLY